MRGMRAIALALLVACGSSSSTPKPITPPAPNAELSPALAPLGDGTPELVLTTYGPSSGDLVIFDAGGNELHRIALGARGAMPVPTIADVDGNGTLDIVVSLKDGEDRTRQVVIYEVASSSTKCLLWPTGRGNLRRDGHVTR